LIGAGGFRLLRFVFRPFLPAPAVLLFFVFLFFVFVFVSVFVFSVGYVFRFLLRRNRKVCGCRCLLAVDLEVWFDFWSSGGLFRCDSVLGVLDLEVLGVFGAPVVIWCRTTFCFRRGMRRWPLARMVLVAGGDWRLFWGGGGWTRF
jgi:hypothetical protein